MRKIFAVAGALELTLDAPSLKLFALIARAPASASVSATAASLG
jgi:hypothetical protein